MANIKGSASTEIDAPLDAVWAVVEDVEHWAEWQGTLGEVTVTGKDGEDRVSECKVKIDAKITQISMKLECSYAPQTRMTFERVSGDLSSLEGAWLLEDLGEGRTSATYELEVDPGARHRLPAQRRAQGEAPRLARRRAAGRAEGARRGRLSAVRARGRPSPRIRPAAAAVAGAGAGAAVAR